jgi:hypothetical protein
LSFLLSIYNNYIISITILSFSSIVFLYYFNKNGFYSTSLAIAALSILNSLPILKYLLAYTFTYILSLFYIYYVFYISLIKFIYDSLLLNPVFLFISLSYSKNFKFSSFNLSILSSFSAKFTLNIYISFFNFSTSFAFFSDISIIFFKFISFEVYIFNFSL